MRLDDATIAALGRDIETYFRENLHPNLRRFDRFLSNPSTAKRARRAQNILANFPVSQGKQYARFLKEFQQFVELLEDIHRRHASAGAIQEGIAYCKKAIEEANTFLNVSCANALEEAKKAKEALDKAYEEALEQTSLPENEALCLLFHPDWRGKPFGDIKNRILLEKGSEEEKNRRIKDLTAVLERNNQTLDKIAYLKILIRQRLSAIYRLREAVKEDKESLYQKKKGLYEKSKKVFTLGSHERGEEPSPCFKRMFYFIEHVDSRAAELIVSACMASPSFELSTGNGTFRPIEYNTVDAYRYFLRTYIKCLYFHLISGGGEK